MASSVINPRSLVQILTLDKDALKVIIIAIFGIKQDRFQTTLVGG